MPKNNYKKVHISKTYYDATGIQRCNLWFLDHGVYKEKYGVPVAEAKSGEKKPKMKAGLMLGVNPAAKRETNDFYATDPYAIKKMAEMFKELHLYPYVWECACGNGDLVKPLKELGYHVYSSDLIRRDFECEEIDFLKADRGPSEHFDILTNPPFKDAEKFIRKGMELLGEGHRFWAFLKVQFLETAKRKKLFEEANLRYVIVNSERVCCAKDGEFDRYFKKDQKTGAYRGGTQLYCWFVFEKGYSGEPVIKFC